MQKFIDYLIEQDVVQQKDIENIYLSSKTHNSSFLSSLLSQSNIYEDRMLHVLADYLGFTFERVDKKTVDVSIKDYIHYSIVDTYEIIPLYKLGDDLFVVVTNPFQPVIFEQLSQSLGLNLEFIITNQFCFDRVKVFLYPFSLSVGCCPLFTTI